MGLQNGRLRNHLVKASSQWDRYHAAFLGRLHRPRVGKYMGAWCARSNNRYQYLQIDFARLAKIIKMAIQGRHDANQWVKQYYITHSVNAINFVEYKERNNRKVTWCILYIWDFTLSSFSITNELLKFTTDLTSDCFFRLSFILMDQNPPITAQRSDLPFELIEDYLAFQRGPEIEKLLGSKILCETISRYHLY